MVYLIRKGRHSKSGFGMGFLFGNSMKFKAVFNQSCLYDLGTSDNYDVNKLAGFSTGWTHHNQSARIGWRCINGEDIQILTYSYDKGERQDPQLLGTVKPNVPFECSIEKRKTSFIFTFKKSINKNEDKMKIISVKRKNIWVPYKYLLYPYFGGNIVAPHDMILEVSTIK